MFLFFLIFSVNKPAKIDGAKKREDSVHPKTCIKGIEEVVCMMNTMASPLISCTMRCHALINNHDIEVFFSQDGVAMGFVGLDGC